MLSSCWILKVSFVLQWLHQYRCSFRKHNVERRHFKVSRSSRYGYIWWRHRIRRPQSSNVHGRRVAEASYPHDELGVSNIQVYLLNKLIIRQYLEKSWMINSYNLIEYIITHETSFLYYQSFLLWKIRIKLSFHSSLSISEDSIFMFVSKNGYIISYYPGTYVIC